MRPQLSEHMGENGVDVAGFERAMREWAQTPEGQEATKAQAAVERAADLDRARAERERATQRLVDAGIPKRVRRVLASDLLTTGALSRVARWVNEGTEDDWCLVLSATKGLGKSVAAGWYLARRLGSSPSYFDHRRGETLKLRQWWTATELSIIDGYGAAFEALCEYPGALVVDDLGAEYGDVKGYFCQRLDRLIDTRYREFRPTLITTNLNATNFRERYGERVADRLREGGAFCELRGESLRRTQSPQLKIAGGSP